MALSVYETSIGRDGVAEERHIQQPAKKGDPMLLEFEGRVTVLDIRDHLAFRRRSLTIHRGTRPLIFSSNHGATKRTHLELPLLHEPSPSEMKEIVRLLTGTRKLDVRPRTLNLFTVTARDPLRTVVFTYGDAPVVLQEHDQVIIDRNKWELQFLRNNQPLMIVDPDRREEAFTSIELPFSHGVPMDPDTACIIAELTGAVNGLEATPIPQQQKFLSRFLFRWPRSRTPPGGVRKQIV